jgi:hypothetical protein
MEYPVVADVDGDDEAEILVSGYTTDYDEQQLFCFESGGTPWAPARSVWNQPGYHVTNVNDDLTIPRYPQNQAKHLIGYETCLQPTCPAPYNSFMAQATFRTQQGCVQFPAIDLTIKILDVDCEGDSISLCYAISNEGDHDLAQKTLSLAIWPHDPLISVSTALTKISLLLDLAINEKDTFCVKMKLGNLPDSLFMTVNDPGDQQTPFQFPLTDIPECRYYNNIDSMDLDIQTVQSMVDTAICEGEVLLFHDSTLTTSGLYIIPGSNCDTVYLVNVNVNTKDSISFTKSICNGDSVLFNGVWLYASGDYQDLENNNRGCDSITFLHLVVASQIFAFDTLSICEGDSVWIIDQWASSEGSFQHILPGVNCDTLRDTWLQVHPTYEYGIAIDACPGDSFWLAQHWVTQTEEVTEFLQSTSGCDSTVTYFVAMPAATEPPVFAVNCDSAFIEATISVSPEWEVEWSNGSVETSTEYRNEGSGFIKLVGGLGCEEEYEFTLPAIPHLEPLKIWTDTSILENHSLSVHLDLDPDQWTIQWTPENIFSCPHLFANQYCANRKYIGECTPRA